MKQSFLILPPSSFILPVNSFRGSYEQMFNLTPWLVQPPVHAASGPPAAARVLSGRKRFMSPLELWLRVLTLVGVILGTWSIFWTRTAGPPGRAAWGRWLSVATLLGLGITGLVAAQARANGLAPLGLVSGWLLVGMVWESSFPSWSQDS